MDSEKNPRKIILKYIKKGPWESAKITKKETEKNSKELKDAAWKAGEDLLEKISKKYYNYPPRKKYMFGTREFNLFAGLLSELMKTFQISFRLAEEGYYRVAMAGLRDILELVLMIKHFYDDSSSFQKWLRGGIYTTEKLRDNMFKAKDIHKEIKDFSQSLSNNRHSMRPTLDSFGTLLTNVPYYRRELFEKWCKHLIKLKDLSIKVIDFEVS